MHLKNYLLTTKRLKKGTLVFEIKFKLTKTSKLYVYTIRQFLLDKNQLIFEIYSVLWKLSYTNILKRMFL